jgi:hypothetical protein
MAAGHNVRVTRTRTGLLIIRAWFEPGSSSPLRTQIRLTTDVAQGIEASLTPVHVEAVVEAVRAWLADMVAGSHDVGDEAGDP